jgi:putative ABC transport system permease protein
VVQRNIAQIACVDATSQPCASASWIRTESPDQAFVDRTTSLLEDRLAALGVEVASEIKYVAERDEIAVNGSLTTSIGVLGSILAGG